MSDSNVSVDPLAAGPGRKRKNLVSLLGHADGMFVLGRQRAVPGDGRPTVVEDFDVRPAEIDHRFYGEDHAGLQFEAVAGVAVMEDIGNVVKQARVALGAVAPTVVLVPKAARAIVGTRLDDAALKKLAAACEAACSPIDDKRGTVEYRTEVAGVLARRAATIAFERARRKR